MKSKENLFITFEGIDGAGKSTQIPIIKDWLESEGKKVIVTREPGGTEIGERIRDIFLHSKVNIITELLLVFSARTEHIAKVIKPALSEGYYVLCDRFTDSTYAYQGGGKQVDLNKIRQLEDWSLEGFMPDITFLFNVPIDIGLKRAKARIADQIDQFEQQKREFFERTHQIYQQRKQQFPERYVEVDSTESIEQITNHIISSIKLFSNIN